MPEGATCKAHPERLALATCPRCDGHACLGCWHGVAHVCETCLVEDPASAAPPVAWEDGERGLVMRFLGTLGQAFTPTKTAPGFAGEELAPAYRFFVLTFFPLAALAGVIPFTHTIRFEGSFTYAWIGDATSAGLVPDLLQAMGLSIVMHGASYLALAAAYVSLSKAFGAPRAKPAALRVLLYRGWLAPMSWNQGLLVGLCIAAFPTSHFDPESLGWGAHVTLLAPLVLLVVFFISIRTAARLASGLSSPASFMVAIVPFGLVYAVDGIVRTVLAPLLPAVGGG